MNVTEGLASLIVSRVYDFVIILVVLLFVSIGFQALFEVNPSLDVFFVTLLIGFLVLLLQIPIYQIRGVIEERQKTRDEAVQEVEITGDYRLREHARHRIRLPGGHESRVRAVHEVGHPLPADARKRDAQDQGQTRVHDVRLRRRY